MKLKQKGNLALYLEPSKLNLVFLNKKELELKLG